MNVRIVALFFVLSCLISSCGHPKSAQNQPAEDSAMQASSVENRKMIIARFTTKPEKTEDFISAAKEMIEKVHEESGCDFYQLYQDPFNPSELVFVEEYKNQAAIDAHFATEYFKAFGAEIEEFISAPAEIRIMTIPEDE